MVGAIVTIPGHSLDVDRECPDFRRHMDSCEFTNGFTGRSRTWKKPYLQLWTRCLGNNDIDRPVEQCTDCRCFCVAH